MFCRVPKAIAGRDSMEIEIFGMAGVPEGLKPGAQPVTSNGESPQSSCLVSLLVRLKA